MAEAMVTLEDATIEIAVRRARMDAAVAQRDPAHVAAMAAGAGAELVARQQRARDVLATRLARRGRQAIVPTVAGGR